MPTLPLAAPAMHGKRAPVLKLAFTGFALLLAAGVGSARAQNLPPEVEAALQKAKVPRDAVAMLVADAEGRSPPRLSYRANVPMNPASVMKLVTTYAALDLLGPAFVWNTPVFIEGAVRDGTLYGNLGIKGLGDPKLVAERLWLLLRRVQGLGVRTISGDIVLDHSAFSLPASDPADFDGEPLRPYNVSPDALLLNYKSVVMTFVPDRTVNTAQVAFDPPLAGVTQQASVPLSGGECGDYRATLRPDFSDPTQIRFGGTYPAACLEKAWPIAYADPKTYATRAVEGMWLEMGGKLGGSVRDGKVQAPSGVVANPVFEVSSPTLAEVIRDINKYSNNVMAQQLFLTLSLQQRGAGTLEGPEPAVDPGLAAGNHQPPRDGGVRPRHRSPGHPASPQDRGRSGPSRRHPHRARRRLHVCAAEGLGAAQALNRTSFRSHQRLNGFLRKGDLRQ